MNEEPELLKSRMDYLIDHLKKIKDEINETNARFFNIKCEQRRDLKPIMTVKGIVGFERQSGDIFSVIIEDNRKIGQPIV